MAKQVKPKIKKSTNYDCPVCGSGCNSLHTVFDSENNVVKGIKQCIQCLSRSGK